MKDKYEDTLYFDLFEGDFGTSNDKEFTNKIVKVRKEHQCHICSNQTQIGSYARYAVWLFDGEFMKYYVCQDCLEAIIESDRLLELDSEEDYEDPIELRYLMNRNIRKQYD